MKNKLILIFALAALLLIGGCITKNKKTQGSATPVVQPQLPPLPPVTDSNATLAQELNAGLSACSANQSRLDVDACLAKLAKDKLSTAPCDRLAVFSKDDCISDVAVAKKDQATCMKVNDPKRKNRCLRDVGVAGSLMDACLAVQNDTNTTDDCINNVSRANSDPDGCRRLESTVMQDLCLLYVASQRHDMQLCKGITSVTEGSYTSDRCYAAADTNHLGETCFNYIAQDKRQDCFLNATDRPSSQVDCSIFPDKASVDNCNYWFGTRSSDTSYCYKLDGNFSAQCVSFILSNRPRIEKCGDIQDYQQRNQCISQAAVDANSNEYCTRIDSDNSARNSCLSQVAAKTLDEKPCLKITANDVVAIDSCITNIALLSKIYDKCELIKDDVRYYQCYSSIANNYKKPEVCNLAKRTQLKILPYSGTDYCYEDYAIKTNNESGCDTVSKTDLQNQCHCLFAGGQNCPVSTACPDNYKISGKGQQCCQKPTDPTIPTYCKVVQ